MVIGSHPREIDVFLKFTLMARRGGVGVGETSLRRRLNAGATTAMAPRQTSLVGIPMLSPTLIDSRLRHLHWQQRSHRGTGVH